VPAWLHARFDPLVDPGEWPALLERAPLDVRANRLKAARDAALAMLAEAAPTPLSPLGLRLPEGYRVEPTEAWASGLVEVQDEGSQLLALACEAPADGLAVDLCAGAGGKTLALAAEMRNRGRIVANRHRPWPLVPPAAPSRARGRLDRGNAATRSRPGAGRLGRSRRNGDLVLVDAPCSAAEPGGATPRRAGG
jgi:16S rRNA (cytosine967-C5)-methyltransferase